MATQKIETGLIADSAVTTAKIADNSVTGAKIAAASLDDQVKGISSSADAVAITIDSSENVGIGNDNPSSAKLEVKGAKTQSGGAPIGNVLIADSTSLAANTGGGITFQGVYQTGGAITGFASIEAMKETATHNEYGSALVLKTREDQGAMAERMRIDSSGNLGLGTNSPNSYSGQTALTINSTGVARLDLDISNTRQGYVLAESGYLGIFADSGKTLRLGAGGDEDIRILASGYVGIGTQSPAAPLDVAGNFIFKSPTNTLYGNFDTTTAGYGAFRLQNQGSNYGFIGQTSSLLASGGSNTALGLRSENEFAIATGGSTERMRIDSSGNLGIGTNNPGTKLDVNGAIRLTDSTYSIYSSSASAVIGHIGNTANDLNIYSSTTGHNGLRFHVNGILPTDNTGTIVDADANLGESSYRFKNLYLSSQALVQSGATTAPSFAFTNDTDTGISRPTSDTVNICTAGSERVRINSTGFFLQEGNIDYHNKVPEFSQSGVTSYSSSTNTAYNEGTIDVPGKGEKLVCQTHARGYTNYVHLKTNLTSDNIMFYFRTCGYCYNTGMEEHVYGGYTYNSTIIATEHQTVYGGTHALHAYRGSSGHLCLRIHVNSTGYNEGRVYVYFGGHSPSVTRELEITNVTQRDDGNNAF